MSSYVFYNFTLSVFALAGIAVYYYYLLAFLSYEILDKIFYLFHGNRVIFLVSLGVLLIIDILWYSKGRRIKKFTGLLLFLISAGLVAYCAYYLLQLPRDLSNIS